MKVTAILGSPRGRAGNTYKLIDSAMKGARAAGAEVEYIDVAKRDIHYCNGCSTCFTKGTCVHDDGYEEILSSLLESDGIILASPVYINSVTAQLKALFDRMPDVVHCRMFTGKYGFSISTAGGSHADLVCEYMNDTLNMMGALTTGEAYAVMADGEEAFEAAVQKAFSLGEDLVAAVAEKRKYPEQQAVLDEMRSHMKALVLSFKDEWTHEYEYWNERGWL